MDPFTMLAGAQIGGGLLSAYGQHQANKLNAKLAKQQYDLARHSVKYRVQDAKEAGIHPLYALGAPTLSSSFSTAQNELAPMGQALAGLGDAYNQANQIRLAHENAKWEVKNKKWQSQYWFNKAKEIDIKNAMSDPFDPRYKAYQLAIKNKGQMKNRVAPGTEYVLPGGQKMKPKPGETKGSVYEDMYGEAGDSPLGPYYWNNLWRAWRDYYRK